MSMLGLHDPFFRPLWIRIVTAGGCLGWALFEFLTGAPFWGVLFGAVGAIAAWHFFLVPFPEQDANEPE